MHQRQELSSSPQFPASALGTFTGLVTLDFLHLSSFQALNSVSRSNSLKMKTIAGGSCLLCGLCDQEQHHQVKLSSNAAFSSSAMFIASKAQKSDAVNNEDAL